MASNTSDQNKENRGRPTKYRESHNKAAYKLALLGHTDKELAQFFEVSESTINLWKIEHPKFSESLKNGKEIADSNVAQSLYQRAIGYSHIETKLFQNRLENGELEIIEHNMIKHYPPDTTACIFFLKNRNPDKWRDRKDIDVKGKVDTSLADVSLGELYKRLKELEDNSKV